MTEPTNEQIERAIKDAGVAWSIEDFRFMLTDEAYARYADGWTRRVAARSILAHARTIAEKEEAEAREARLAKLVKRAQIVGADDLPESWHNDARTALQENPDV